jgi:methionine aminotransferase
MTQLAAKYNAVNLAQGFPDFRCDEILLECAEAAVRNDNNQYAPVPGLLSLRRAIANKIEDTLAVKIDPETEVTVTAGAAQAIFTAIGSILSVGDEVIILEPAYDSYIPAILSAGGVVKTIILSPPSFSIDWNLVEASVSKKTKLILINTPNNPTGKIFSSSDINALARIVEEHNLTVISDEVYEHITFDGACHNSILQNSTLKSRSYVVYSFGKTLHVTGWKIGYCIAPPALTARFREAHQYSIFSVNTPSQAAIASYLPLHGPHWSLSKFFQEKRDRLAAGLAKNGFQILETSGTYFQLVDFTNIQKNMSDLEFSDWLTINIGVACIPLSSFYRKKNYNNIVRFCFAKKNETIDQAIQKMSNL